jgi:hypothetical protein
MSIASQLPLLLSRARAALLLGLLALTTLPACAVKHAYPGQKLDREGLAQIEPAFGISGTQIVLHAVDGIPLSWQHDRAAVPPGRHQLRASMVLRSRLEQRSHSFDVWFDAKAGTRYLIFGELSAHGPRLWITDGQLRTVADTDSGVIPDVAAPPRRAGS